MTDNKGDLISRSALKKAYFNAINETTIGEVSIIDIIDNAPTVDISKEVWNQSNALLEKRLTYLERPQGEWELQYRSCGDEFYTCSVCGRAIVLENSKSLSDFPFCNCGADMRGEKV